MAMYNGKQVKLAAEFGGDLSGAVIYSRAQSLTEEQKAQARENIGAGTGDASEAVLYGEEQNLTDAQKARARANIGADSQHHTHTVDEIVNLNGALGNKQDKIGVGTRLIAWSFEGIAELKSTKILLESKEEDERTGTPAQYATLKIDKDTGELLVNGESVGGGKFVMLAHADGQIYQKPEFEDEEIGFYRFNEAVESGNAIISVDDGIEREEETGAIIYRVASYETAEYGYDNVKFIATYEDESGNIVMSYATLHTASAGWYITKKEVTLS